MTDQPDAREKGSLLASSPDVVRDFCRATEAFVVRQRQHGQALTNGNIREVFVWLNEREQAFRGIVRSLDQLVASGKLAGEPLRVVLDRLQVVISGENELELQMATHREEVREQLSSMRKGRGALQGYSVHGGLVPRPRYCSNRT